MFLFSDFSPKSMPILHFFSGASPLNPHGDAVPLPCEGALAAPLTLSQIWGVYTFNLFLGISLLEEYYINLIAR